MGALRPITYLVQAGVCIRQATRASLALIASELVNAALLAGLSLGGHALVFSMETQ
jgi:hypothetical protein